MSTDITKPAAPQPFRPAPAAPPAAAQGKPETAAPAEVKLALPEKTDLQFDPKAMQKNLQEAIERLNDQMKSNGRQLNCLMDKSMDRTVIQVKNAETGEVIRQIPNEPMLRVAHSIEDVKGMLLDEKS